MLSNFRITLGLPMLFSSSIKCPKKWFIFKEQSFYWGLLVFSLLSFSWIMLGLSVYHNCHYSFFLKDLHFPSIHSSQVYCATSPGSMQWYD